MFSVSQMALISLIVGLASPRSSLPSLAINMAWPLAFSALAKSLRVLSPACFLARINI